LLFIQCETVGILDRGRFLLGRSSGYVEFSSMPPFEANPLEHGEQGCLVLDPNAKIDRTNEIPPVDSSEVVSNV